MKETIERLKILADRADKYKYPKDSNMGVRISDIDAVLEFYERHKGESEPPPNVPDLTPEWDKILDGFYFFAAIDANGEEYAYQDEPFFSDASKTWQSRLSNIWTGRTFNMKHIDWTKTLSKRPAK